MGNGMSVADAVNWWHRAAPDALNRRCLICGKGIFLRRGYWTHKSANHPPKKRTSGTVTYPQ